MGHNINYECRYTDFNLLKLVIVGMIFMCVWE